MKINKPALVNLIILTGGLLFLIIIALSFISSVPVTKTVSIYSTAWKNAQPQIWFVDEIEYSINSDGYATFRIYIKDKLDYIDSIWNIQYIPEYMADYLKEIQHE